MLMIFEGNEVEVFELNGQVLFNPRHVGECLDISPEGVRKAITRMNGRQVIKIKNSDVTDSNIRKLNNAGENFLTESGVYKLIFKSKKKEAEKFQDWVTDEVLPSIRKHGMYATDDLLNDPDLMIEAANKIKEEKEGRLKAESQVKELTDKVVKLSIDVNNLEKRTVKGTTLTDISCCTDTPRRLIEDYCFSMGWYSKKNNEVIIHDITLVTATRRNAIEFTSKGAEILIQQFSKNGKPF